MAPTEAVRAVAALDDHFVGGLLEGLDASRLRARLSPAEGRCCVVVGSE